jgi:hypothetical protein
MEAKHHWLISMENSNEQIATSIGWSGRRNRACNTALARESHVKSQHHVENANVGAAPGARNNEHSWILAPRVGAFAIQP